MEEREVQGVYSHPPATGGICLGGVVAADVGDAIRIDDLRGIKIPYYDGNPSNLDDFILDCEDFTEEVVGEMKGAPRDKWVCRTFPHRLAQDLKEELRDQIREGSIQTEQACLQWLEDEERVDAPNQKLEDLWSIPLPLERGGLRGWQGNRYIRKYQRSLKLVEDWSESSEIRHLLKDVLPGHWKRRVEDEEKKRTKKCVAVRIMASEDIHAGIMEFIRRNLGEPSRMLGLKNAVYVEVFGDTMGQRLTRLNNAEWRRGEPLRMQVIFARMSLDEIVKYITVELKLNAKNEAHVQDRQGREHRGHREDQQHREVKEDTVGTAEEGSGSGQDLWTATTREDHEEAHFFAFVANNTKEHGQDRSSGTAWTQGSTTTARNRGGSGTRRSRSASTDHSTTVVGSATARGTTMHMTTGIARYMRMTRRPTSPPIMTRSPRSNELLIGRQRAKTVEKAKERAKGKAEQKAMVEDPAPTDA